jgi:monolysocardiolipin acyltransferase
VPTLSRPPPSLLHTNATALYRQFFLNGKTLPVARGAGVNQASISVAARALGGGDWLHIFPEGRVVPDGSVGPFRQGIGKLICEARAFNGRCVCVCVGRGC